MEPQLVGRERAEFAIRALLWIGAGVLVAGVAILWLFSDAGLTGPWVLVAVVAVAGLGVALIGTALVAIGVRLGLAAYGAASDPDAARRGGPRGQ